MGVLTRRHVERGTASKVRRIVICRGQAKVGKLDSHSIFGHEDILRLEVPVVDPERMAKLYGIQDLEEHTLGQEVITDKVSLISDVREQVSFWAILHDDVGTIHGIHDAD